MQKYLPELLDLIGEGRLNPEVLTTHHLSLEEAAHGYEIFDEKRGLPENRPEASTKIRVHSLVTKRGLPWH